MSEEDCPGCGKDGQLLTDFSDDGRQYPVCWECQNEDCRVWWYGKEVAAE